MSARHLQLLPAVKRYWFQYKVFIGLVWLNTNHMFGSRDLRDQTTLVIFESIEIALDLLEQFQNFQKCSRTIAFPKMWLCTIFMLSNDKDNLLMELHIYCNDYNFLWKISS